MLGVGTERAFHAVETVESLAIALASAQKNLSQKPQADLLENLNDITKRIADLHERLDSLLDEGQQIQPAEEWLVDNYHFIQEQLRRIAEDMPHRYYVQLPVLAEGDHKGYPRIYEMAHKLTSFADYRLDPEMIHQFLSSYQTVSYLTTGELWAFAIILRIALMEGLAMLLQRCQDERDGRISQTYEDPLVEMASRRVSVSNIVLSLRLLAAIDWPDIVEATGAVDHFLRKDPAGTYERCNFFTRDQYRHAVEELARGSATAEWIVAETALRLAQDADAKDVRKSHIGYYLVDQGRAELEAQLRFRPGFRLQLKRLITNHPFFFYQIPIIVLALLFTALVVRYLVPETSNSVVLGAIALLMLIPASAVSITFLNWLVTLYLPPRSLPSLQLKDGIPSDLRTIVVVPAILGDPEETRQLVSRLEIHYLANSDDSLEFAILSDYPDAETETTPHDARLLQEAQEGIAKLNEKHPRSTGPRFHLFHRVRKWNDREEKWMGWERKRGKLEEFNRMLMGVPGTTYLRAALPHQIRYVITLDSDSILPRNAAQKMIATLAHPLNHAVVNPGTRHVTEGYGILQPRVSHTITSTNKSLYAMLVSGPSGIDPYTTAVSDIYQDLFSEASFVGKGIYDLRAFHACLDKRFPDNTLLSHDLIEGAYARTGLVTEIELFDDHPTDYSSSIRRNQRWVRGDWQVALWLLPDIPARAGATPNTLSLLNRWKLLDNLRRSLVSPFLFLVLLLGWTVLPGSPVAWGLVVLSVLAAPFVLRLLNAAFSRSERIAWVDHVKTVISEVATDSLHVVLANTFLANEAYVMTDAIVRTLSRMSRKRKLLEWVTAAQGERSRSRTLPSYYRMTFGSIALAVVSAALIFIARPSSLPAASPWLLLWTFSPVIAWFTGREIKHVQKPLSPADTATLRSYALDSWRFFDSFCREEDHWLPCDNFQETPEPLSAHRTSPTNIGFALLANIAAYDFGYIGSTECVDRTEKTLATLTRLKTFNGHLFNWYDTQSLTALEPRYISTVDSGNLAAALIVMKQFALQQGKRGWASSNRLSGLQDHIRRLLHQLDIHGELYSHKVKDLRQAIYFLGDGSRERPDVEDLLRWLEVILSSNGDPKDAKAYQEIAMWREFALRSVRSHLADYSHPQDLQSRLLAVAREAEALLNEMDFRFLFDEDRGLFSIGFNVSNARMDSSYYDLFASEARLSSLIAIAKGDVPQSHWFRMSRAMSSNRRVLASWSGSMFEYLMPLLFLRNHPNTLLEDTCIGVVNEQRKYASSRNVPWGISEAGFNARDASHNYQYGPFGVPTLGIKHGLERELVIAPYATFLALQVEPELALQNLKTLEQMKVRGNYGFYESVDYTKDRLVEPEHFAIVKAYMAHHQGMSLCALNNVLNHNSMQQRFHSEPSIRATELLLQEKIPSAVSAAGSVSVGDARPQLFRIAEPIVAREFHTPFLSPPRTQILSNNTYMVVLTTGGSGYSECNGIRITRWDEDATRDLWGVGIYIKDLASNAFFSAGYQPACVNPQSYNVVFAEDRVEFRRTDGSLETRMDVSVSSEDNAEVRRVAIVNTGSEPKDIEITSYMELVLESAAADLAHPAFQKLFVRTEYEPDGNYLLATRRSSSPEEFSMWAAHTMSCNGEAISEVEYETDRARFIGRTGSLAFPASMSEPLSGSVGSVLDPIFSLRRRIRIAPYSRAVVTFTIAVSDSKAGAASLALKYGNAHAVERAFELSATHSKLLLQQLSLSVEDAHLFQRVAGRMIFTDLSLRPRPAVLVRNSRTQSALWSHSISGDLPICLVRVEDQAELDIVSQLVRAHEYWRVKGFKSDLVILNEYPTSYYQELQEELTALVRTVPEPRINESGGVFLLRADLMSEEDRILLRTVARVQIIAQRGSLAHQVARREKEDFVPPEHEPTSMYPIEDPPVSHPEEELLFDNGWGGFSQDGREYRIRLREEDPTPAPWIHVVSNERFGFHASELGSGMTWSVNSRENRITPWSNDPVCDPAESAVYVRDDESGKYWSATPAPARGKGVYHVSYGAGYARWFYGGSGIHHELLTYVPQDRSVKVLKLTLRNPGRRRRSFTVTYFSELVLGVLRSRSAPFVVTSVDKDTGALLAVNSYNNEFANRITFFWINDRKRSVTGDRTGFLGLQGNLRNPDAMLRSHLSGRVGAGLDPCAALQSRITLEPLSTQQIILLVGQADSVEAAQSCIRDFREPMDSDKAFSTVTNSWDSLLGRIQVRTPDDTMNVLMNRWLLYQTVACRFLARSAFYQSGGAIGFRDQLQDSMAFVYSEPGVMRTHLLLAAAHQFVEGDVQHWWHPPTDRGVRTRSSDDLLWLPYTTLYYLNATSDAAVLNEQVGFLQAAPLAENEMEAYLQPEISEESSSLYEHCALAIDRSLTKGEHGLPLIGAGDWNDGLNRIGIHGRGESAWLGWFLLTILKGFIPIAKSREDSVRVQKYEEFYSALRSAMNEAGWDGEWFVRGFDDEGRAFGSSSSDECRIDSIAQSWAVLSGDGDPVKSRQAMESVRSRLLLPEEKLAPLFTPPFTSAARDPGYIRGYPPGIRENGGQYNHAVAWLIAAFCELGDAQTAHQLFHWMNPISRSSDRESARKYRCEPYVVTADIYTHPEHMGKGGWSWYTGSASWLYRVTLESILGFRLNGDSFSLRPCLPKEWPGYELSFKRGETLYKIVVHGNGNQVRSITLDDSPVQDGRIPLDDQPAEHTVIVEMV